MLVQEDSNFARLDGVDNSSLRDLSVFYQNSSGPPPLTSYNGVIKSYLFRGTNYSMHDF
jgi:hypothetical protein